MADIKSYFPDILKNIKEFKVIDVLETPEMEQAEMSTEKVMKEQFLEMSEEYGLKRWESMLNILTKKSDTFDERRFRIKARINEYLPYTWNTMEAILDNLCGSNGYERERIPEEFAVIVRVGLANKKKFDIIKNMLEDIIPSNMTLEVNILYNRHWEAGRYKHGFLLSYTHDDIRQRRIPIYTEHKKLSEKSHFNILRTGHSYIREEMHKY